VREYLREFLSDPRVVKLPRLLWLPILHGIVLRKRPAESAAKYAAIWTPEGSPLAVHTRRQAEALQRAMPGTRVAYAMRYGAPGIASVLQSFSQSDLLVVPLYPQYAEGTTESVADRLPPGTRMVREFHDHPGFIDALAARVREHWQRHGRGGMLVMSFHGLPRRGAQVYEGQCRATAALLQKALALPDAECRVTFQSRFGYAEWLQPYTEPTLRELAASGVRRVDVCFPGFVADCLETLEEIGIGARHAFLEAGGREFYAVSCLNDSTEWIRALAAIARGSG
jgi:ferrochelatase